LKAVVVRAGHKVLMDGGDNTLLVVGDLKKIFDQQLKPKPVQLF
jgi:hypothetical protein